MINYLQELLILFKTHFQLVLENGKYVLFFFNTIYNVLFQIKQIENIGDVQDKLLASLQECDRLKDELEKAQEEAISTHQQLDDEKQKYCTLENEKNQLVNNTY